MKPIKLSIEGLNSFIQKQTIDFNALGVDNLFCISGSTGSGKTTIVDAIILALYGSIKRGSFDDIINLSCQKAVVELNIEFEDEEYIIVRELRRGKPAKAMAYKKDGTPVANSVTELNKFVLNKIGLEKDQFTRVVMLQQGEFDKFLSDNRNDRMKVIEKLTDVSKYKKVVALINEDERNAKNELENMKNVLDSFSDVSDEILNEQQKQLEVVLAEEVRLADEKNVKNKFIQEIKKKLLEYKAYEEREVKITALKAELDEIEKEVILLDKGKENSITYSEKLDKTVKEIAENGKKREEISVYFAQAEQAKNITENIELAVKEYKQTEKEKIAKEEEIEKHLLTISATKEKYGFSEDNAKEIAQKESLAYTELYSLYTAQQTRKKTLAITQKEYDASVRKLSEKKAITPITERGKNEKADECAKAKDRVKNAEEILEKLRSDNALGIVLSSVKMGEKCPICGNVVTSLSHVQEGGSIAEATAQLKSAKDDYERLLQELTKLEQSHVTAITEYNSALENEANLKARVEELVKEIGEEITLDKVKESEQRAKSAKEFESCVTMLNSLKGIVKDKENDLKKRKEEGEKLRNQQKNLQQYLIDKCGTCEAEGIKNKINMLREKDSKLEQEKKEIEELLRELSNREIKLSEKKKNKQEQYENLKKEHTYCEKIDQSAVESAENELKSIEDGIMRAISEKSALATRIKDGQSRLEVKKEKEKEYSEKQKLYDNLKELKDIFKGSAFTDFVADAFIEDITAYASEQMADLSSNQYSMEYREGAFYVNDYCGDGGSRNVTTLSGGEKFLASLSLAIAISRRTAHSRDYGFFFIDEGFGTLDEATLETVCASLEKLADDTMVGVITHRNELIDRIPSVLKVTKADGENGSICTLKL
ncbi:MAG: SMC family ATPase [Clostridiales bacterium]|nr:SMC family ATPase [Clostridiales bacterium]